MPVVVTTITMPVVVITMRVGPAHGAGGICVGKSAATLARRHVGKIVGHENGQWIVQSGNDGHAVRTRPRSLAGAIAFRQA
jgi:hypothetical protein